MTTGGLLDGIGEGALEKVKEGLQQKLQWWQNLPMMTNLEFLQEGSGSQLNTISN